MLTLLHDLHDLQDPVHVLPGCYQTLQHQHLEVVEHVTVRTAHHLTDSTQGQRTGFSPDMYTYTYVHTHICQVLGGRDQNQNLNCLCQVLVGHVHQINSRPRTQQSA